MIIGKAENEQLILINKEGTKKTRILFGDRILYTVYEYTTSYFGEKLFFYLIFNYDLNTRNVSFEKARNYEYGTTSPILDVPIKKWEDLLNS